MLTILVFFISFYRTKGDAPGSVPQPNIAFAPCPSNCDGKCVDTCPDYCCVKGATSKTTGQSQPAQIPQLPQVIIVMLLKPLNVSLFDILKQHSVERSLLGDSRLSLTKCNRAMGLGKRKSEMGFRSRSTHISQPLLSAPCTGWTFLSIVWKLWRIYHCFKEPTLSLHLQQAQQGSEFQQTSQSCPAICAKLCYPDCPVRCCSPPPPSLYVPSPPPAPTSCPQICYSTCVSYCPAGCCTSTQRGVNRDMLSYSVSLPCPTNCYPSCHGNCPLQCCKAANERYRPMTHPVMKSLIADNYLRMPGEREVPFMDLHPPSLSNIMIRSKLPCPDICKKVCSLRCSKECCRKKSGKRSIKQQNQNTADLGNQHFKFEQNASGNSPIICKLVSVESKYTPI